MRSAWRFVFAVVLTCIAGCATSRPAAPSDRISASFIVWPKTAVPCDYEHPDRDAPILISTTRQTLVRAVQARDPARTYLVRDAQLVRALNVGDALCAVVIRYQRLPDLDAIYGFEVTVGDGGALKLNPAYARRHGAPTRVTQVAVVIAAAWVLSDDLQAPEIARLDFGPVPPDHPVVVKAADANLVLLDGWIRRFAVVVTEGRSAPVSDADLLQLLNERGREDE